MCGSSDLQGLAQQPHVEADASDASSAGGPRKGGGAFSQVRWGSMPITWTNCHEATVSGMAKLSSAGCEGGKNSTAKAALPQCFICTGPGALSSAETLIFFIPRLVQMVMSIVWFRLDATSTRTELPNASQAAAQKASSMKILRDLTGMRVIRPTV